MKPFTILTFLFASMNVFAQQQTFDITTFTAPAGWEQKPSEAGIQFIKEDTTTGAYCVITLFKSAPATTNAKENFELAWTSLVKDMIEVTDKPIMGPSASEDGWEVLTGHINFEREGIKGVALLVNSSGFEKMVNVVILTNSDVFEKNISGFLESITLKKPEPAENYNASVIGTWGISSVTASYANMSTNEGSILTQYTFNPDGTYSFYIKTFQYQMEHLFFTRETGKYHISGNNLTIEPQKSVIESWSKKEGTDNWGKLVKTQKKELEKITYQFDIQQFVTGRNLVLRTGKLTKRDGNYNNYEKDAWLYAFKPEIDRIKLPGADEVAVIPAMTATGDGYKFNTTNFDDGWTSTVQEDWVQVIKGTTRVLIHYPNKEAGGYTADAMEGLKKAWSILVAPRYSNISEVAYKPIRGWESMEIAEADAVDNSTGQPVHIVLFKKNYYGGSGKYLECITPDKNLFVQEFGEFDATASGWEKLERLANYNKFAVAASDLTGKWTSNFSGTTHYVNVYTGLDAGMSSHASNQNFQFGPGNTYNWDLSVASGMVGSLKFQNVKSSGKFSMLNNWQIHFSDMEGKPKTYDVAFTCVKGARVLWVDGTAFHKKE
jgi:hypothetical protein